LRFEKVITQSSTSSRAKLRKAVLVLLPNPSVSLKKSPAASSRLDSKETPANKSSLATCILKEDPDERINLDEGGVEATQRRLKKGMSRKNFK
jgi:hypothetical protein